MRKVGPWGGTARVCTYWNMNMMDTYPHPWAGDADAGDTNDIAIIKSHWRDSDRRDTFFLSTETHFAPICIPDSEDPEPAVGETVHAFGWMYAVKQLTSADHRNAYGLGLSRDIHKNALQVEDRDKCPLRKDKEYVDWDTWEVYQKSCETCKEYCLQSTEKDGAAVCAGDEGGPLVKFYDNKYHVVGIVTKARPCSIKSDHPATFLKVTPFMKWIKQALPELQLE